jgi:hypothetical protein
MFFVSSVRRSSRRILVSSLAIATLGACGGQSLRPFQPQFSSSTDNFQLQATSITDMTTTVTYTWVNTGTRATLNHSTTTTAGSTLVVIKDAAGDVVLTRPLRPRLLNEPSIVGQAGSWTIQLTLLRYSGTLNFRVQKL